MNTSRARARRSASLRVGSGPTGSPRKASAPVYEYSWKRQNWFGNNAAEHMAIREGVGIYDMSSFGKIRVEGRGRRGLPEPRLRQ